MWNPLNIMRLVPFLLLIQLGYIIAKAVENPHSCSDSAEGDPRLRKSDEKEIFSDIADTTGRDAGDPAARKTFSTPNTNVQSKISNDFAPHSNTLPKKLPLVNNINEPAHVEEGDIVINKLSTTKAPLPESIYYKAIDPKYIIVSGLSFPKPNKNKTNVSTTEKNVNDFKETMTVDNANSTKETEVLNKDEANDTEGKTIAINDFDADVTNIRELREHLLDHLLDYFLNIIKEENIIRNDTRKKNGKDRMKVEEKLRNYYDPHHLDKLLADNDDDDYEDSNIDSSYYSNNYDSEEDLLDNVKRNEEKVTNISLNTLAGDIDKNAQETHRSPENLKTQALTLENNLNNSSPVGESLHFNVSESTPVTSTYINIVEKGNNSSKVIDDNVNVITTTEISISNNTLNDEADDTDLNYSDEAVTAGIEYIYDSGAFTVNDNSYEDFSDSDELQVVKNVTVHEKDKSSFVIITEDGRRKNLIDKEKYIANGTLNETTNPNNKSQNLRNGTTNSTTKDRALYDKGDTPPNDLGNSDLPNENSDDVLPYSEDNLPDNKKKNSKKKSKQDIKRNLRSNKKCGKVISNLINKINNKQNCRQNVIFNLKINLF